MKNITKTVCLLSFARLYMDMANTWQDKFGRNMKLYGKGIASILSLIYILSWKLKVENKGLIDTKLTF